MSATDCLTFRQMTILATSTNGTRQNDIVGLVARECNLYSKKAIIAYFYRPDLFVLQSQPLPLVF